MPVKLESASSLDGLGSGSAARHTIGKIASVSGIGLHLGKPCNLEFQPAPAGSGIRFVRTDLPGSKPIPASVSVAVQAQRRTQLGEGEAALHTVEHVLAAVSGLGIDDLIIAMDGPEPPIADGSSDAFSQAILNAGVVKNGGNPEWLVVRKPFVVTEGDSVYEAYPSFDFTLDVRISFPHDSIGEQTLVRGITPHSFLNEISSARTFGFLNEVETLRAKGLIQGASMENAIVLNDKGIENGDLRWPDEFVRHKMLDCVGDFSLAGARIRAHIVAHRPSHHGTVAFVRELVRNASRESSVYTIEDIMKVLPHRYPFLLVDRILEIEEGKRIVGIKNVTINEPFFQGHFPGHPVMPGVLMIEAMAQVGGMLMMRTISDPGSKVVYFMSLDNIKFRKPVRPGDQLRFELVVLQMRGSICKMHGEGFVDGELVVQADMAAMIRDQ